MDDATHRPDDSPAPEGSTPPPPQSLQSPSPEPAPEARRPRLVRERSAAGGQSRTLWALLIVFLLVLSGPFVIGRFIYHATYNELKAGYDVATSTLTSLKPRLNDLELASRLVAKRVEPSVVSIIRPGRRGLDGQGSGVIVDEAGYIVTNSHVVAGARTIEVRLSDRRTAEAAVVGSDPLTDIAVLKIDLPNLIAAEWGDSEEMQVGALVWALGSPYGLERSLTFGIVSAKSRRSGSRLVSNLYQEYLQTDAAVNPGNSGGPLVNIEGQIVGINAAIFGTAYQGISFAIPSELAREKYQELRDKGRVERAFLGIQPLEVPQEIRERLGLEIDEGVLVGEVEPGTPASRTGLRPGDIILKWNNHVATDPTLLSRAIAGTEIGSMAKLTILRSNGEDFEQVELDVELEARPAFFSQ